MRPPAARDRAGSAIRSPYAAADGSVTLQVDDGGILPAAASGYVSVPGSINATAFGLTSSTSGTLSPTPGSSPLTANTVYSILVGGDVAAPQLLIR